VSHGNLSGVFAGILAFAPTGPVELRASAITFTVNSHGVESVAAGTSIHHAVRYTTSSKTTRVSGFNLSGSERVLRILILPEALFTLVVS